jgi:hypothetical protein
MLEYKLIKNIFQNGIDIKEFSNNLQKKLVEDFPCNR